MPHQRAKERKDAFWLDTPRYSRMVLCCDANMFSQAFEDQLYTSGNPWATWCLMEGQLRSKRSNQLEGEFLHSWLVPHPNCASKPAEINPRWRLNAPDDPVPITLNEIQKGLRFLLLKVTTSRQIDVLSKDPPRTSKKSRGNYSAEAAVCIAEALRKLRRRLCRTCQSPKLTPTSRSTEA